MNDRPMMICADVDEALLAYLEETLDRASRSNVDQHVASCVRCSAIMRDLAAIRSEAERLPELAPSRDLWKGISERIEPAVLPLSVPSRTGIPSRWIPFAAAAAAALVIGTAGITYLATSRSLGPSSSRVAVATQPAAVTTQPAGVVPESVATSGTPEETQPGPAASAGSAEAQAAASQPGAATRAGQPAAALASRRSGATASSSDIAYGDEIKRLQNIITDRRRELDPATISVIEESLKIIDAAVKQSRAALARDPRSGFLVDQLNSALDKKVELLRTVALLPSRT